MVLPRTSLHDHGGSSISGLASPTLGDAALIVAWGLSLDQLVFNCVHCSEGKARMEVNSP